MTSIELYILICLFWVVCGMVAFIIIIKQNDEIDQFKDELDSNLDGV